MKSNTSKKLRARQNFWGYTFTAPSLILMIVFLVAPIFISLFLSLTKFTGFKAPTMIGINNFVKIMQDKKFWLSMKNTVIFVAVTVPVQFAISLGLAAMIAEKFRNGFGETIRGLIFIPVLSSSAVAGNIFYYLFASNSDATINAILANFGIDKINWLGMPGTALFVICLVSIWKAVGYFMVIFYSAIMDVPKSLHEAARVDGATPMQRFWHITLPGIKPVSILVLTLSIIWAFQVFDITMVLTKGGPGNGTMSPVLYIYNLAFMEHRMGYASAMALVLAVAILIVTVIQKMLVREED